MAKFMICASYNAEGLKGVMKAGGTSRVEAVGKMVAGVGGSIEAFYFGFGAHDVYVVVDVPSNLQAAAVAAAVTRLRCDEQLRDDRADDAGGSRRGDGGRGAVRAARILTGSRRPRCPSVGPWPHLRAPSSPRVTRESIPTPC